MRRNFLEWLGSFRSSIANYVYYVDFDKIYSNIDKLKLN